MAPDRRFEEKMEVEFCLKWREIPTKMNFGHPKWPPVAILKNKVAF
jgi:hypothetical protein